MTEQPTLKTGRLVLRPFRIGDAPAVQRLAGDRAIADTTLNVPHPYADGMAEAWIESHRSEFLADRLAAFAITLPDGTLVGCISLRINRRFARAELGYWIGTAFWGQGYGTEAAREMLRYGFQELGLNRIFAHYLDRNPASGRVMEKIGMQYEGHLRQHVKKWEKFEDLTLYGILKSDWQSSNSESKTTR